MNMEQIGRWLFLLGAAVSVVVGFMPNLGNEAIVGLFVLGIIIGILNVTGKESHSFLLAAVALLLVGSATGSVLGGLAAQLEAALNAFTVFVAGAALLVALREVVTISREK